MLHFFKNSFYNFYIICTNDAKNKMLESSLNLALFWIKGEMDQMNTMFEKKMDTDNYSCNLCDFQSQRRFSVKRHVIYRHTPSSNIECKDCKRTYKNKFAYRQHNCLKKQQKN